MKKSFFYTVALLLAGTMMTACSGGDDVTSDVPPVPQPAAEAGDVVVLSGTLGSKGSVTRAIDAEGKGTWKKDDQFAIYYETSNGHSSAVATVNNVNEDGSADFTATLSSPKTGDNVVKLVYPASAHDDEGGFNTDGLMNQGGTLEYINANGLDIETAATTMNVEGTNATLKSTVTMKPQVCLYTFNLKKDAATNLSATELEISDGTHNYTITTATTNSFTVALLPASGADFTFAATTTESGLVYTKQNVTLTNCTSNNVGDVFDSNGNIYSVSTGSSIIYSKSFSGVTLESGKFYSQDLTLAGIMPVALIAYVGDRAANSIETGNSTYHGLAIAMEDCNSSNTTDITWYNNNNGTRWCEQTSPLCTPSENVKSNVDDARILLNGIGMTSHLVENSIGNHNHWAAKAAAAYNAERPTATSVWFLPSLGQWQLIIQGLVSKQKGEPYTTAISTSNNEDMMSINYNSILTNAGANQLSDTGYWSCSEVEGRFAWNVYVGGGSVAKNVKTTNHLLVRPVLAF